MTFAAEPSVTGHHPAIGDVIPLLSQMARLSNRLHTARVTHDADDARTDLSLSLFPPQRLKPTLISH
jgi:hypothetical protein